MYLMIQGEKNNLASSYLSDKEITSEDKRPFQTFCMQNIVYSARDVKKEKGNIFHIHSNSIVLFFLHADFVF